ncbi:MAG: hypothetical protein ACI9R3_005192 [Verrucomicrobiales bacterium]|jgi:hypothetical protein
MGSHCLPKLLIAIATVVFATAGSTLASQINWRSPILAINATSSGAAMDASFDFQLGTFASGFQPSADNLDEWSTHWSELDTTEYNATTRFFSSSVLLTSNDPFVVGTSGYFWGRNGSDNEWILLRSVRWRWPVANNGVAFPLEWEIDQSTVAILGEVNGEGFLMKSARVDSGNGNAADQWLADHFTVQQLEDPAISSWNADPDLDGATNLLEFTTGGAPLKTDAHTSTVAWDRTSEGGYVLRLPMTEDARQLVAVRMQFSTSMKNWLPLPAEGSIDSGGIVFNVTPGTTALYYRVYVAFQ